MKSLKRNQRVSGRNIKVFLDANIILSGLLFNGNEATLLELGRIQAVTLITNQYVIEEVTNVLNRQDFHLQKSEVAKLIKILTTFVKVVENPSKEAIKNNLATLDDKKDIPVALGSECSEADYLVTGDKELLEKIHNAVTTKKLLETLF